MIGLNKGNVRIMTIRPEQPGIGFGDDSIEITSVPLIVGGEQVFINNTEVNKTKLYDTTTNTTSYIAFLGYPDQRAYSVMIPSFFDDNAENKELSDIYDRVISTIRFVE